jgi:hypothetical protein
MTATLTDGRRATFAALAEALVPGGDGMPSASDAGVPERWIDRAVESRPDLAGPLAVILDAAAGQDPSAVLARLEATEPAALETLQLLVSGAYFMSPRTRRALAYPGQKQDPVMPGEAEYYGPDELLAPVRARGSVYRAVD